jgi:hypothetical protein
MMKQEKLPSAQGSSHENWQVIEEQDLEQITGGFLDSTPLLEGEKQTPPPVSHPNNGTYLPPVMAGDLRKQEIPVISSIGDNTPVPHPSDARRLPVYPR